MRRQLPLVLVAVVAMLVLWGSRSRDTTAAAVQEARADSLWLQALSKQHALTDAVRRGLAQSARARIERDSLRGIADRATARRPAVVAEIERVAGDSVAVVAAVRELEALHLQETTALRAELLVADHMLAAKDSLLVQYADANASLERALTASRSEADEWKRAARPRLFGLSPQAALSVGFALGVATVVLAR